MASYEWRGKRCTARVKVLGHRETRTFDTKGEARTWATALEAELRERKRTGSAGIPRRTLLDGFERYKREVVPQKDGGRWEAIRLDKFAREMPFVGWIMDDVTPEVIGEWRNTSLQRLSPASVLREMNLLSSVFQLAKLEWKWVRSNPVRDVRRPKGAEHRDRRVYPHERRAILDQLQYTPGMVPQLRKHHVATAWLFALEAGMRQGEILRLTPPHVHLRDRYVHVPKSKNGNRRNVPLSAAARELLELQLQLEPAPDVQVFHVSSATADATFRRAVRAAGVEDMTFHDSRHEACTQLAKVLNPMELARVLGQRDLRSLMIYYNATASELSERIDGGARFERVATTLNKVLRRFQASDHLGGAVLPMLPAQAGDADPGALYDQVASALDALIKRLDVLERQGD